jgi:hypothetical protein
MIEPSERQYWLWVTHPEYYDSVGSFGGWSCHKNTKQGDLAFLWRAKGKSDIGFLLQVESDAVPDKEWGHSCDYKTLYVFQNPVNIKDLRADSYFDEWSPLKRNLQGKAFEIQENYWNRLNQIAIKKNPDYREIITSGRSLEQIAEEDLDSLSYEEEYSEGKKSKRFVNYYERNRSLNIAARQIHGTKCMVCGFDFEQQYGARGSGYIEVHHMNPISSFTEETKVDPKTEMTVVCSNCHRMIHRKKDEVLSMDQIKELIRKHAT